MILILPRSLARKGELSILKTVLKRARRNRKLLIHEQQEKIAKVKTISDLLPICSACKIIHNNNGYWNQIEGYISRHSDFDFSRSMCANCAKYLYPEMNIYDE